VNKREIRREANFQAGLILESVIGAGWPADEMSDIAQSLRNRGGRE
jgi:hypothetical protein